MNEYSASGGNLPHSPLWKTLPYKFTEMNPLKDIFQQTSPYNSADTICRIFGCECFCLFCQYEQFLHMHYVSIEKLLDVSCSYLTGKCDSKYDMKC